MSFAKVIMEGRLTQKPEVQHVGGKPVLNFSVAVNSKDKTSFINCVAWNQNANFISQWFNKGSAIVIFGVLQTNIWKDNSGKTHNKMFVLVENVTFTDGNKTTDNKQKPVQSKPQSDFSLPDYEPIIDDGYDVATPPFGKGL